MPNGDIADIPEFPNWGFKPDGFLVAYDIDSRKKEIESNIISNDILTASKLFMDFVNDFDTSKKYSVEAPIVAADCNSLEEDKPSKGSEKYQLYRQERSYLYRKILEAVNDIINYLKVSQLN